MIECIVRGCTRESAGGWCDEHARVPAPPTFPQYVGERARRLRKARGMSQSDLSKASGIQRPNLTRFEAGRTDPQSATLVAIAKGLRVTVAELVTGFEEAVHPHTLSYDRLGRLVVDRYDAHSRGCGCDLCDAVKDGMRDEVAHG